MGSLSELPRKAIGVLKMLSYQARASGPSPDVSVGGHGSDFFPVVVLGRWRHRMRFQSPSLAEGKKLIVLQDRGLDGNTVIYRLSDFTLLPSYSLKSSELPSS